MAGKYSELKMPLKRVALFLSGVAYFEHSATAIGGSKATFQFKESDVKDALKSLTVIDPECESPQFSYLSEDAYDNVLAGLKIDIHRSHEFVSFANSLRGAEIEVSAREKVRGKIIGAEVRETAGIAGEKSKESFLSIYAGSGGGESAFSDAKGGLGFTSGPDKGNQSPIESEGEIRIINVKDIRAWRFVDKALDDDMKKGLEMLFDYRDDYLCDVNLSLPAEEGVEREAKVCYVIAAPVWKATYRLDIGDSESLLQAWAIIDNSTDNDWDEIELSLLAGKPSSFVQDLYQPYFVPREEIPLPYASSAKVHVFGSGSYTGSMPEMSDEDMPMMAPRLLSKAASQLSKAKPINSAKASQAGEQFSFTMKSPVTIGHGRSAMLPMFSGSIEGMKASVLPENAATGAKTNPALAVELINGSGLPLPAASISVFDDGLYAGDALLEFLPEGQKRIISYGDDLSVEIIKIEKASGERLVSAQISNGSLNVTHKIAYEMEYSITNASSKPRRVIIEHHFNAGSELEEPKEYFDKTLTAYRFEVIAAPKGHETLTVREERPVSESVHLGKTGAAELMAYSERKLPEAIKKALDGAAALNKRIQQKNQQASDIGRLIETEEKSQERIRANIAAVGPSPSQSKPYLAKLALSEKKIEELQAKLITIEADAKKAEQALSEYLDQLNIL